MRYVALLLSFPYRQVPFPSWTLPCVSIQSRPRRSKLIDRAPQRCQIWLDVPEASESNKCCGIHLSCTHLQACRSRATPEIQSELQEVDVHARASIDVTRPLDTCPWPTLRTCLTHFQDHASPATRSNFLTYPQACLHTPCKAFLVSCSLPGVSKAYVDQLVVIRLRKGPTWVLPRTHGVPLPTSHSSSCWSRSCYVLLLCFLIACSQSQIGRVCTRCASVNAYFERLSSRATTL